MSVRALLVVVWSGSLAVSCFRPAPYRGDGAGGSAGSVGGAAGTADRDAGGGDAGSGDATDLPIGDSNDGADPNHPDADALDMPEVPDVPAEIPDVPPDLPDVPAEVPDVPPDLPEEIPAELPDANSGADDGAVAPDVAPDGCHNSANEPPVSVNINGHSYALPSALRAKLVLWLDPSNLDPVIGSPVASWCDRSGKRNDAISLSDDDPPRVIQGGGVGLTYGVPGSGFSIDSSNNAVDLGADDFLVLVVSAFTHGENIKTFFRKSDGLPVFPTGIWLSWDYYPPLGSRLTGRVNETTVVADRPTDLGTEWLFGLRRVGDRVELRINGNIEKAIDLATPGASTTIDENVYLGLNGDTARNPVDSLRSVVVVRGTLSNLDVGALESYLKVAFNL